jgi:hypothetical protein
MKRKKEREKKKDISPKHQHATPKFYKENVELFFFQSASLVFE